jgi:hypothetical protein
VCLLAAERGPRCGSDDVVIVAMDRNGQDDDNRVAPPMSCPHVALAVTSPPYCLGIQDHGYIDFTVYADYLAAAATWAAEL